VSQTFTYRLKPEHSADAKLGARITVPFGKKLLTAYIVALHDDLPSDLAEVEIKEAEGLVDPEPVCTPEILQLARWVAEYYGSPLGEVLKATLPPGGPLVRAKLRRFVRITDVEATKLTDGQQRVLETLRQQGPLPLQTLIKEASVGAATVSSLAKKGVVEVFDEAVRRDPLAHTSRLKAEEYTLTPAQNAVLEKIQAQVNEERYAAARPRSTFAPCTPRLNADALR
jgi:primosomal protein N' (replication factor Y)